MVAHSNVPREKTVGTDGEVGVGVVEEERIVLLEVVEICCSAFMAERLFGLFVIEATEAVGAENLVDAKHVAVFCAVIGLVDTAVEVADDKDAAVMEVGSVFADDFLGYLRVGLVIINVLALRRPNCEDEKVLDEQGDSIDEIGIVPFGDVSLVATPNHAEAFPT